MVCYGMGCDDRQVVELDADGGGSEVDIHYSFIQYGEVARDCVRACVCVVCQNK